MKYKKLFCGVGLSIIITGVISGTVIINKQDNLALAMETHPSVSKIKTESSLIITKEDIHLKMLNSIDNFDKAVGKFIYHSSSAGYEYEVSYNVKTKKNDYKSNVKIVSNTDSREVAYDGNNSVTIADNNSKSFRKYKVGKSKDESQTYSNKKAKDRYKLDQNGEKVYERRLDPTYMDMASLSLFPEDFALGFLEDYNKWDIVSDKENINGYDVVIIEGELNPYYQMKHNVKSFKLWVEKNTGIVLQMEEYNQNGEATEFLKTKSIKINDTNQPVPDIIIPKDYKLDI